MTVDLQWDRLLTKQEAAAYVRVNVKTIENWMKRGKIDYVRIPNGKTRILVTSLVSPWPAPSTWRDGTIAVPRSVQRFVDHLQHDPNSDLARQVNPEIVREILMRFLAFL